MRNMRIAFSGTWLPSPEKIRSFWAQGLDNLYLPHSAPSLPSSLVMRPIQQHTRKNSLYSPGSTAYRNLSHWNLQSSRVSAFGEEPGKQLSKHWVHSNLRYTFSLLDIIDFFPSSSCSSFFTSFYPSPLFLSQLLSMPSPSRNFPHL